MGVHVIGDERSDDGSSLHLFRALLISYARSINVSISDRYVYLDISGGGGRVDSVTLDLLYI